MIASRKTVGDHFEPDEGGDPKAQRQLRGHLEQIDYTAYASNRQVMSSALGHVDAPKFQRLAVAAAYARARWVATGLAVTESGRPPTQEDVENLANLRRAYEELTEVYDAMRRVVERAYLPYSDPQARKP
ncbi:MAG TPA: hypothetical protein VN814_16185 [Caulobacteraceae bacterium]|nr:hypothetical protein [Caulobacteraceae bacterium]